MQELVLQLLSEQHTIRRIAKVTGLSRNTVRSIIRADEQDKTNAIDSEIDPSDWRTRVDWPKVIGEHDRRGTPIKTLHREFAPDGVTYMAFWHEFRRQNPASPEVTIRLQHEPGERCYFDFADGVPIVDRVSGAKTKTQLLVSVLPFSSLTEAEFLPDQKQPNFIRAIERAFQRFGGVTPYVVVDNLKSAVQRAHLYDPDTNKTFVEFANHMGFAVLPARPYKPRDKAAVEAAVGVIQRQFFHQVRDTVFYSLEQLNNELRIFLDRLNNEPMKDHGGIARAERAGVEREKLKALPLERFELHEWRRAKVHPDCHIQVDRKFYSVPFQFVGQTVHVRIKTSTLEIFSEDREALAVHPRLAPSAIARASTLEAHYPEQKSALARFDVKAALKAALRIGPETHRMIEDLFSCSTPLKFLRRAQGILALHQSGRVSTDALEHASARAMLFNKKQLTFIKDAALFYQARGVDSKSNVARVAPIRLKQDVFLHNNHHDKE
jgi:transposase